MSISELKKILISINENLKNIEKKISNLELRVISVESKLDLLGNKLQNSIIEIDQKTDHMVSHIHFVNSVYDSIKKPFHSILNYYTPTNNYILQ